MKLISEHAPKAVKEQQMENYFARKVAIDASMSLYQFLVSRERSWAERRAQDNGRAAGWGRPAGQHSV
jgi:flap endonuclease-1